MPMIRPEGISNPSDDLFSDDPPTFFHCSFYGSEIRTILNRGYVTADGMAVHVIASWRDGMRVWTDDKIYFDLSTLHIHTWFSFGEKRRSIDVEAYVHNFRDDL